MRWPSHDREDLLAVNIRATAKEGRRGGRATATRTDLRKRNSKYLGAAKEGRCGGRATTARTTHRTMI